MKRLVPLILTVILIAVGLPSKSYADNSSLALVWGPSPILNTFEFGKNGFLHLDLSKKVKWYRWDLENNYYLSLRQPFSIRIAQEIKILDKDSKCTSVPIKVRRHLSLSQASDSLNSTSIQFFASDIGFNKGISTQQVISRPIIFTIGPSDWKANSLEEQDFSVPVCEDSIGRSLSGLIESEITLNFRYSYSTNADQSYINIDPKCDEIKDNRCIFNSEIVRVFRVKFTQTSPSLASLKSVYQETIGRESDYLQAKPCEVPYLDYDQQSNSNTLRKDNKALCESRLRNLEFLNSEIATFSRAILSAELKAKQDAEVKAALTKKTTITCVKGKLTKKVTAVKPKCPAGYKKK